MRDSARRSRTAGGKRKRATRRIWTRSTRSWFPQCSWVQHQAEGIRLQGEWEDQMKTSYVIMRRDIDAQRASNLRMAQQQSYTNEQRAVQAHQIMGQEHRDRMESERMDREHRAWQDNRRAQDEAMLKKQAALADQSSDGYGAFDDLYQPPPLPVGTKRGSPEKSTISPKRYWQGRPVFPPKSLPPSFKGFSGRNRTRRQRSKSSSRQR